MVPPSEMMSYRRETICPQLPWDRKTADKHSRLPDSAVKRDYPFWGLGESHWGAAQSGPTSLADDCVATHPASGRQRRATAMTNKHGGLTGHSLGAM